MEPSPLDRFIARPDVRERFETTVRAPAERVFEVAAAFDLHSLAPVRAIFRLRERLLGAHAPTPRAVEGLLDEMRRLGWGVLDERPGRVVVCGARCQPWLADVRFTAIAPDRFAHDATPDHVRIAWSIEAHPLGAASTRLVQETRVIASDASAQRRFRRYWRWARFGIVAIRLLMLPAVRRRAERRWAGPRSEAAPAGERARPGKPT